MAEKASVRLVDVGGVVNPVTGGVSQAVDGTTVVIADEVLLPNPPNGSAYAGVWVAAAGAWTRRTDWDTSVEMVPGDWWYVREGALYQGTTWAFENTAQPATLNVTPLTIGRRTHRRALEEGAGIDISGTTPPIVSYNNPSDLESSFIEGLHLEYLSANGIRVKAGAAYIPASGVADMPLDADLTGLTLTGSTWYYIYAYDAGGGVLAVDPPSTQAPNTAPYRGAARSKGPDATPDLSRRYLGSIYASASNVMRRFKVLPGGFVRWVADEITGLRAVSAATNNTTSAVDISSLAPATAEGVEAAIILVNSDNNSTLYVSASGDGLQTVGTSAAAGQLSVVTGPSAPRQHLTGPIALVDNNRTLHHRQSAVGASRSADLSVLGYWEDR